MNSLPRQRSVLAAVVLLTLGCLVSAACSSSKRHSEAGEPASFNVAPSGLALGGYDPVAYFPEGGGLPKRGLPALTATFRGATYRFASEQNRARFLANPQRYEPQFGGWCAWAMVDGEQVEVDPKSFLIEGDQLLLFYDGLFADTRSLWLEQGGTQLYPRAVTQWNQLISDQPELEEHHD